MYKRIISLLGILILSPSVMAYTFGQHGRNGFDGGSASDGYSPPNEIVYADGSHMTIDLRGGDADNDARDGQRGEDAYSCFQPMENYDVRGADGGDGGDGGLGGRGGDGGDATVFFKDFSDLKKITIMNTEGRGSMGGYGEQGGFACRCSRYNWVRQFCYPFRQCTKRNVCTPRTVKDCKVVNGRNRCTTRTVQDCKIVEKCRTVTRCENRNYRCFDGQDGRNGRSGSSGVSGNRGAIKIVKDLDRIPNDNPSMTVSLVSLENQDMTVSQNIWSKSSGARSLFARGSDIADTYTEFIETATNTVGLEWNAQRDISEFGDVQFGVTFSPSGSAQIRFLTKHLFKRKTIRESGNHTQIIIDDAYKISEVNQLTSTFNGRKKNLQIVITDKALLSKIINNTITLRLQLGQLTRNKTLFEGIVPADKMIVSPGQIIIKAGELARDNKAMRKGRKIRYDLSVRRSYGADYTDVKMSIGKTKIR